MATTHAARLADLARRAGDRYVEYRVSERFHRDRLDATHDREEARAKLRQRGLQARRAFRTFLESLYDLVDGGGNEEAAAIFEGVQERTAWARRPTSEVLPC